MVHKDRDGDRDKHARIAAMYKSVPIMCLPIEIRNKIYLSLALVDQFKIDCCNKCHDIFNPYNICLTNLNSFSAPIILYMYKELGMIEKVSEVIFDKYINQKGAPVKFILQCVDIFDIFSNYEKGKLHEYYNSIYILFNEHILDKNEPFDIDVYIMFTKFCLAKLDYDKNRRPGLCNDAAFWDNFSTSHNHLIIEELYCEIYVCLIGAIFNYDNPRLYDLLVERFIESDAEYIKRVLYFAVNNSSHVLCLFNTLVSEDHPDISRKLRRMHIKCVRRFCILFDMFEDNVIDISELEEYIIRIIYGTRKLPFEDDEFYTYDTDDKSEDLMRCMSYIDNIHQTTLLKSDSIKIFLYQSRGT